MMNCNSRQQAMIKKAREFRGLSHTGLGKLAGVAGGTVRKIEAGKNAHPDKVKQVVAALELDQARFYGVALEKGAV